MTWWVVGLRTLVFGLWLFITVVPYALFLMLASIFLKGTPLYRLAVGWNRLTVWGAKVICGVNYRVQGWEHVDQAHAQGLRLIVCPKHQSAWETFFLSTAMPRTLSYVFKSELLRVPFFGWALGRLDMVHIDRSRRTEATRRVSRQGRQLLDQGNWIIMFPEGTRGPEGGQLPYNPGAARLAVDTQAPILPIAVTSARCWPRVGWLIRPGLIEVSVGAPIAVLGRKPKEVMAEVQGWIETEMRRLDPQAYVNEPPALVLAEQPGGEGA
jgi:1-acyl-sn-glycerol-3-phosphate acyltransferase